MKRDYGSRKIDCLNQCKSEVKRYLNIMLNQDLETISSSYKVEKNNICTDTETSITLSDITNLTSGLDKSVTKTVKFMNATCFYGMKNNNLPNNKNILPKSSNPETDWQSKSYESPVNNSKEVTMNDRDEIEDKSEAGSVNNRIMTRETEDDTMAYVNSIVSDEEVMEIRKLTKHIDKQGSKSTTEQTNIQCDEELGENGNKIKRAKQQRLEDKSGVSTNSKNTVLKFVTGKQKTMLMEDATRNVHCNKKEQRILELILKVSETTSSSFNNLVKSIINIKDSPVRNISDDIIDLDSTSSSSSILPQGMDTNDRADDSVIVLDNSSCADIDEEIMPKKTFDAKSRKLKSSFENIPAANTRDTNSQSDDLEIVKVYRIPEKKRKNIAVKAVQITSTRNKLRIAQSNALKIPHVALSNITYNLPKKTATNSIATNKENRTRAEENTVNKDTEASPKQRTRSIGDCPVCLDSLNDKEIMSTNCGHLFCMQCIVNVIRKTRCCPNCRKRLSLKSIHPIYI